MVRSPIFPPPPPILDGILFGLSDGVLYCGEGDEGKLYPNSL